MESGSYAAKLHELETHFLKDTGARGEGSAYTKIILEQREGPDTWDSVCRYQKRECKRSLPVDLLVPKF